MSTPDLEYGIYEHEQAFCAKSEERIFMKLIKYVLWHAVFVISASAYAQSQPAITVSLSPNALSVQAQQHVDAIEVRVVGDQFNFQEQYNMPSLVLDLMTLGLSEDGEYHYEITSVTFTGVSQAVSGNGRDSGGVMKESVTSVVSGRFNVTNYAIEQTAQ